MVVQEKTNRVVNNLGETHTFKIQTSSKAFDILSDKLYKDKITAVIRETVTNGIDSHIAAKQSDPVQVHVPTLDEVFFSVKDTGLGLSEEDVIHMYTTYFSSTKAETNDFVGGLGLGSKSPFSYTDQFQVISVFNGLKMVFSAFKSERNEPNIVLVSKDATEDHNGLEVIVPVQPGDVQQFRVKANLTLFWMKDKISTNVEFKYNLERSDFLYSDLFEVLDTADKNAERIGISGTFVKIGTSVYPVDVNQVGRLLDGRYYDLFNYKFGSGVTGGSYGRSERALVINVGIGVLDVAPSREELSYDKRTVKNLIDVLKLTAEDIDRVAAENINNVASPYLRAKRAAEVSRYIGNVKGVPQYNDNVRIFVAGVTSYDMIRYGKNDNKKMEAVRINNLELSPTRKIILMDVGADYGKNKLNHQLKRVVEFGTSSSVTVLAFSGRPSKQLTDLIGTEDYTVFVAPPREAKEKIEGGLKIKIEPQYSSMAGGLFTLDQIKKMKNVFFIDYVSRKDDWTYKVDLNYEYLRAKGYEVLMLNKFEQKKVLPYAKDTDALRQILPKIFGEVVTARQTSNAVEQMLRNKIIEVIVENVDLPILKGWMTSDLYINRNVASKAEVSHRLMNIMATTENVKLKEINTEWDNFLKSNVLLKMLVDNWNSWKGLSVDEKTAIIELINSKPSDFVKIA